MLTVVVGFLGGGLLFGVIAYVLTRDGYDPAWDTGMFAALGCVIGLVVSIFVSFGIGSGLPQKQMVREHHALVSWNEATKIEGQFVGFFFVAEGTVDSKPVLNYIIVTDKGYQFQQIDKLDPNLYVVEEDRTDAEIDVVNYTFQNSGDGTWALPRLVTETYIHVPRGSITTCSKLTQEGSSGCPTS